jgi:hypothetical protein
MKNKPTRTKKCGNGTRIKKPKKVSQFRKRLNSGRTKVGGK